MTLPEKNQATPASAEHWLDERPSGGIPIQCQFCPCQSFRRSRLRSKDLSDLFLMRYPVRCLRCGQRQTVSYTIAAISIPSHIRHKSVSQRSRRPRPDVSSKPATPPRDESVIDPEVPPPSL